MWSSLPRSRTGPTSSRRYGAPAGAEDRRSPGRRSEPSPLRRAISGPERSTRPWSHPGRMQRNPVTSVQFRSQPGCRGVRLPDWLGSCVNRRRGRCLGDRPSVQHGCSVGPGGPRAGFLRGADKRRPGERKRGRSWRTSSNWCSRCPLPGAGGCAPCRAAVAGSFGLRDTETQSASKSRRSFERQQDAEDFLEALERRARSRRLRRSERGGNADLDLRSVHGPDRAITNDSVQWETVWRLHVDAARHGPGRQGHQERRHHDPGRAREPRWQGNEALKLVKRMLYFAMDDGIEQERRRRAKPGT